MLEITSFILGPVFTNTYLIAEPESKEAVIVDPADPKCVNILDTVRQNGWKVVQIWITHAHFDHTAGLEALQAALGKPVPVGLHADDLPLWRSGGDGAMFGLSALHPTEPDLMLSHGQNLQLGSETFEVRHVPGHCLGHVEFYNAANDVLFCGDLIFRQSVGRTDLADGDQEVLMRSIREQVLTLSPQTRLLPGHGEETTVAFETKHNPFL